MVTMATSLPRVIIAAPASGHGKTTVATGLMAALAGRGLQVSGHKVGPDYIDPGYHSMATGRPGRNLDPFMVGEERIVPLLLHGAAGADVAVIEGVMGLFDGRLGTDGEASTAHVAALTSSPVVLVIDISHASRTHAAVVAGLAGFDPAVQVSGVILNKTRTAKHSAEVTDALARTGIPVLGVLPRDAGIETPSRHLGLVPAAERAESAGTLTHLANVIAQNVDLDALLDIASTAADFDTAPWNPKEEVVAASAARPVVAVAGGRAFTFRYAETEELLRAAGCEVVGFDPLTDQSLPEGTAGLYLGGGFPEVHATGLAANSALLAEIRTAIAGGLPTVAECAGFAYLCDTVDGTAAVGAIPAAAAMTPRLSLGYRTAIAPSDSLLAQAGERITGHEFHRTCVAPASADDNRAAWELPTGFDGFAGPTLHASYLHVHWAGHPQLAQRFADTVHAKAAERRSLRAVTALHHHGDAEIGEGLLDFAVNVYAGRRPRWLDSALHDALGTANAYPDTTAARLALAERHGRPPTEILPTAGATEAFFLVAALRPWRKPVVIHPQFTEPHSALINSGRDVTSVLCRPDDGFRLHPDEVPDDADLVIVGNPTNPTGVLHPAYMIRKLLRPGRIVLVDEAFLDAVPGEPESLADERCDGLLVARSLTKHWSIPGIRAGYLLGQSDLIAELARRQLPWSVSTPAIAAMRVCSERRACTESHSRALILQQWRREMTDALAARGLAPVSGHAPFLLVRAGAGVHAALRRRGVAVRRADTFPGLDDHWIRIAVRDTSTTEHLLQALDDVLDSSPLRPAMRSPATEALA